MASPPTHPFPAVMAGLCGAAFGAPGPGDHKGEHLETDFVVINHEVPRFGKGQV